MKLVLEIIFSLYFNIILSYFFFLFIPHATSLTFNLTKFSQENQKYVHLMDSASYFFNGMQLTADEPQEIDAEKLSGRATYIKPFHIWDSNSGELASFTTYFSFLIDSKMKTSYGDGLTFFLAEDNSVKISGPSMGLPINGSTTMARFVAVEFDTFQNEEWDPRNSSNDLIGDHVGINVNSLISNASEKWFSNITGGKVCKAWITYDYVSKNLSVSFTGFKNNTEVIQSLYHIIDLREVLPQKVIFGFSAATTGALFQMNTVQSWSFHGSVLKKENRTRLVVGLIVGFSILVTFVGLLVFFVRKKNKKEEKQGI